MSHRTFVGRQPIVDRDRRVVAYELLFRASRDARVAEIQEVSRAVVRVMVNTFTSMGVDAVLGRAWGFFNVDRETFLAESLEALPRERVVLEILEDVEPDAEAVARCRALHAAGFRIALDDWVLDDPREALLPWAEVVKVDLPAVPRRSLRPLVRSLRGGSAQLLAEKVETVEEFEQCHRLGFDLFQGYFFAKPVVLEGADLDATRGTLLRVLQQVSAGAETAEIVESFKQDAKLGLNLLRLVNSAGHSTRVRLETIEDAIRHLGRAQLGRWVAILLYAEDGGGFQSPLLALAAHRGRLMERLVALDARDGRSPAERASEAERGFLVGMLSLADALLGRPIAALVEELRLAEEVGLALTEQAGGLGALLGLVCEIERGRVEKFEPALEARGLDLAALQQLEHDVYAWVHGLTAGPV